MSFNIPLPPKIILQIYDSFFYSKLFKGTSDLSSSQSIIPSRKIVACSVFLPPPPFFFSSFKNTNRTQQSPLKKNLIYAQDCMNLNTTISANILPTKIGLHLARNNSAQWLQHHKSWKAFCMAELCS